MLYSLNWLREMISLDKKDPGRMLPDLAGIGLLCEGQEKIGDDLVFELEIPANRGDLMSVWGLAREVSALYPGRTLKPPVDLASRPPGETTRVGEIALEIEEPRACRFYAGTLLEQVRPARTPPSLSGRLETVGLRGLGNLAVDITNYLLFGAGQPLHAFDADLIEGGIVVRFAREGEELVTLDGQCRKLGGEVLVIADRKKVLAAAGIMGGLESEVTAATSRIFLESAFFNPAVVRAGRKFLGMQTDSAARFERGVDPALVWPTMTKAAEMIERADGGQVAWSIRAGSLPEPAGPLDFRPSKVASILGVAIESEELAVLLERLGCRLSREKNGEPWSVIPPAHRADIKAEIDLVEEAARFYGFEKLPSRLPRVQLKKLHPDHRRETRIENLRDYLVSAGFDEVVTTSLRPKNAGGGEKARARVINPLSADQELLRDSLLPSIFEVASGFRSREPVTGRIFEFGSVYGVENGKFFEEKNFALLVPGEETGEILFLKTVLLEMAWMLGERNPEIKPTTHDFLENAAQITGSDGTVMAVFGTRRNSRFSSWAAEFRPGKKLFQPPPMRHFSPWARYPEVVRDYSILVPEKIEWSFIERQVRALSPLVAGLEFLDLYRGEELPAGYYGLTFSLVCRNPERTLSGEEIDRLESSMLEILADAGISLRENTGG